MQNSFYLYLNLSSFVYFLVLISLIWIKRNELIGAKSLVGLIAANAYALVNNSLILSGNIENLSWFFWLGFFLISLFPVFFRSHINSLLRHQPKRNTIHVFLVLFWMFIVYLMFAFYLKDPSEQTVYFMNIVEGNFPADFSALNMLFLLTILLYFIDTGINVFKQPKKNEKGLQNLFEQSVRYSRNFWLMLVGNFLAVLVFSMFLNEKTVEYVVMPICMNVLFLFVIINLRSYSLHYKFEKIDLNEGETFSHEILTDLKRVLLEEEMFLENDCSIEKIATKLGVSKNKVSRAINGGLMVSSNEYINSLRISYAKDLLMHFDPKSDTIEGVGYSSGFNSKASFYRAFKKFSAQTPTDFIEQQKKLSQITN